MSCLHDPGTMPHSYRLGVDAELAEDAVGVLADGRDRIHHRFDILHHDGRGERSNGPNRRLDRLPAPARQELRMISELTHRIHAGVGDLRSVQLRNQRVGRPLGKALGQDSVELDRKSVV